MLECPEDGELPEAMEADRVSTRKAAQAPNIKTISQCSPVVVSQSIDIMEHANDRRGYGGLVVAKEATEDEIGDPLTVPQLCRRLLYFPPQNISQVPDSQGGKPLTLNSTIIIDAQISRASKPSTGSLGGTLPPKRMPRMALQSTGSTPI